MNNRIETITADILSDAAAILSLTDDADALQDDVYRIHAIRILALHIRDHARQLVQESDP